MKKEFRLAYLITATLLIITSVCGAQVTDTVLIKKLSINGVCLCNITATSLRQQNVDLKDVDVEEMDLSKDCAGQDSRYIAGKGYTSEKYPGMVFQKDRRTDQVSKIRLTKKFAGKLPDGKMIDVNKLRLKDLLVMYPKLKTTWGSRGCSDYWNFSNDTLSFYVKIDKNKQPQFPIDEFYYYSKPIEAIDLFVSCYSFSFEARNIKITLLNRNDPVFFIDSIRVNRRVLENFQPSEFASITVLKNENATKAMGDEGKNGIVYLETKKYARQKYWEYFKSKSVDYAKVVTSPEKDSAIQYILNKKPLTENYEADLVLINDKTFKDISIITRDKLIKDYGISDKEFGVVISADMPVKTNK